MFTRLKQNILNKKILLQRRRLSRMCRKYGTVEKIDVIIQNEKLELMYDDLNKLKAKAK